MGRKKTTGKGRRPAASRALRSLSEPCRERRFEPKASHRALLGVTMLSFGGLCLGAATYAQFFRESSAVPLSYTPFLMVVGAVLVLAYMMFGTATIAPLYVGEFGVGIEKDERVERIPWYLIRRVHLDAGGLRLKSDRGEVLISLEHQGAAARLVAAEAQARISKRVKLDDEDLQRIGRANEADGELVDAEPPQVTNMLCCHSEAPLTIEKDVRMCVRCGAFYHKDNIPSRCGECGKKLKSRA